MGLKGKRNKVEVLRFEASQLPCFVAVYLLALPLGLTHLAATRTGILLFTASLLPPASLPPSSHVLALLEEGQVATPEFSCFSVLDYFMWFPVFIPGRSLGRAASSPSPLGP